MSVVHSWSKYQPKDPDAVRRHTIAQSTWTKQPWEDRGVEDNQLPRLFNERGRKFPFIRDIFDHACRGLKPDDIVIYTNADIGVVSNLCFRIALALQPIDAGYSFRRDLHKRVVAVPKDNDILQWHHYPGTDLFFFRVVWWQKYRKDMPELIPAREEWDGCLRVLMTVTHPGAQLAQQNLCWHERHGGSGYWEQPANRYTLGGQIHNLTLAKRFMRQKGFNPAQFGIR